jgi:hypothetical protein
LILVVVIVILGGGAFAAYRFGLFNRKTERDLDQAIKKVGDVVDTIKDKTGMQ